MDVGILPPPPPPAALAEEAEAAVVEAETPALPPTIRDDSITLQPTKLSQIPKERLSAEYKTPKQLLSDIKFFFTNYGKSLQTERRRFKAMTPSQRRSLPALKRLHNQITGRLQASSDEGGSDKRIGIVLSAGDYLRDEVRNIILSMPGTLSAVKVNEMKIDINIMDEGRSDGTEVGDRIIKRAPMGGVMSKGEGITKYIPSSGDSGGDPEMRAPRRKGRGIQMLGAQKRTQVTTANRMVKNNPFQRSRPTMRLKYFA